MSGIIVFNPAYPRAEEDGLILVSKGSWTTWSQPADVLNQSLILPCDPTVEVGDVVYLDSSSQNLKPATASFLSTSDVIGIVKSKPNITTANVVTDGKLESVFSNLNPGASYFLSIAPGEISTSIPSQEGSVVLKLGTALTSTSLILKVGARLQKAL